MSEWQPISTQPDKDSTYCDLPGDASEGIGFALSEDDDTIQYLVWWKYTGGGTSTTTHWQPLPAPPSA